MSIEEIRKLDKLASDDAKVLKMEGLINQATNALISDTPDKAAQALQELAYMCAKGGRDGQAMFEQLRKLAITGAIAKTDAPFIEEKLKVAERDIRSKRIMH